MRNVVYGNDMFEPDAPASRLVQESSAIGEYENALESPDSSALWLGENHHLNRDQVGAFVELLQHWLDTGKLQEEEKENA